jgi:IclR family acetate operon transcriptional repressor
MAPDGDLNSVLGKCFALLDAINQSETKALSLGELTRTSGVQKASVHRIAKRLVDSALLQRDGDRYSIGLRVFEYAHTVPVVSTLRDRAMPYMVELHHRTGEVIHLATLDGPDVVYLEKVYGPDSPIVPSGVGGRAPSHCTGLGKALLAFSTTNHLGSVFGRPLAPRTGYTIVVPSLLAGQLTAVRSDHIARDNQESVLGLSCIAAPILDAGGRAIGAISITAPTQRFRPVSLRPKLLDAADQLAAEARVPQVLSA